MSDKSVWLVICRFNGWEMNGVQYPAFAHQYLIEVPNNALMQGLYLDNAGEQYNPEYSEQENVKKEFVKIYEHNIQKKFDGEILIVEQKDYCILPPAEGEDKLRGKENE